MSKSRGCLYYKAVDQKWYVALNDEEYDYDTGSAVHYGSFDSEDDAIQFVRDGFSNPGGSDTDDSGEMPVPSHVVSPKRRNSW